jgi:hypothetical protein
MSPLRPEFTQLPGLPILISAMSPARVILPCLLACAFGAAPAAAKSFLVTTQGNSPSVAVDKSATAHVVWDSTTADHSSITHYCRVPRKASTCAAGSERVFAQFAQDQDFGGPRVYLQGARTVFVVTTRCCTVLDGNAIRVYLHRSDDGGATFGEPVLIGTQTPDLGAALGGAGFFAFGSTPDDTGTGLQTMPLTGGSGTPTIVTTDLAETGGIGPSPKGTLVAYANRQRRVFAGALNGTAVSFRQVARGSDVAVASGPKGADLLYRTTGSKARFFTHRFANGRLGKPSAVSEPGFPIFGTIAQDAGGRVHAAWQGDKGLTYRVSKATGRNYGKARRLSPKFDYYNLTVAANAKGKAVVAYDSNKENGRVGGFTTG